MRAATRWVTALVAVLTIGCSGDAGSAPTAEVADSAGVRIVTYDLTDVTVPTYWIVDEHDLEVGVLDGAPEYTFSSIPDLAIAHDGSIIVSDGVAQELRVYDANGTYHRTIGQPGQGPGEFATAPDIAGLAGDTVFAFDSRSRRVTSFLLGGDLIATTEIRSAAITRPTAVIRQDDGTYLSQSPWVDPSGQPRPQEIRMELDSIAIEHLDATGGLIDTVRVLPDRTRARAVQARGGGIFATQQANTPYSPQAFMRSDGVRAIVGHSASFELELAAPAGGVQTILRVFGVQHPATADDIRAREEEALRERLGDDEIASSTWMLNIEFLPDRLPAFTSIVTGDDGDLWVALTEYDMSVGLDWLVFTPGGVLRGMTHTPPDMQLFEIRSDFIVGVVHDEFDVPYVRRYPLLPRGDGSG